MVTMVSLTTHYSLLITHYSSLLPLLLHVLNGFLDHHDAADWTRDCTANHQQIVLSIYARNSQASNRNLRVAHVARGAHSRNHSRRIRRRADRARGADIHRTMTFRAPIEMVALDGTGKTSPLRLSHHFDQVTVGKKIYQHLVANVSFRSRRVQEQLFEHTGRRYAAAGFLKMAAHRQGHALQPNRLVLD